MFAGVCFYVYKIIDISARPRFSGVITRVEIITGICGVLGGLQGPSPVGFILLLKAELESHELRPGGHQSD